MTKRIQENKYNLLFFVCRTGIWLVYIMLTGKVPLCNSFFPQHNKKKNIVILNIVKNYETNHYLELVLVNILSYLIFTISYRTTEHFYFVNFHEFLRII